VGLSTSYAGIIRIRFLKPLVSMGIISACYSISNAWAPRNGSEGIIKAVQFIDGT